MDLSQKTADELKVMAYDLLVESEQTQQNLKLVNQAIADKKPVPK